MASNLSSSNSPRAISTPLRRIEYCLWTELQIVGDIDRRHDDAQFLRGLFSNRPDAVQEVAALLNVDNADQAVANLNRKAVDFKKRCRLFGRGILPLLATASRLRARSFAASPVS